MRLTPEMNEALLSGQKGREMYRIVYLAKAYPDQNDLSQAVVAQVATTLWAVDVEQARKIFMANIPEELPPLYIIAIQPVGGLEEEGMLEIKNDPTAHGGLRGVN